MSISSCRYDCENSYVDVKVGKYAIDIDFENKPPVVFSNLTSNSATFSGQITVADGTAPGRRDNLAQNIVGTSTLTVNNSFFKTVGYRLFFHKGYLKCVKKEISAPLTYNLNTVSVGFTNTVYVPTPKVRHSFYNPAVIWDSLLTLEAKRAIQDCAVELATQFGIEVPKEFYQDLSAYEGVWKAHRFAALDWLAYPIVRELNSITVCDNMTHEERTYIAPKFEPMSFKQLVEHYYGSSTGKLLSEVWKIITVGGEYQKQIFGVPEARGAFFTRSEGTIVRILEDNGDHLIQVGDKHIQVLALIFGSAIFRRMGFDYFYQAVPLFSAMKTASRYIGLRMSPSATEFELVTLLKFISPKKLLGLLFSDENGPDSHLLHDTVQMLRTYDGVENIPRQLRLQYPLGLRVDFKFKTLKELHDKISTQYTIIQTESTKKEILVSDLYAQLDGREYEGCKLVVPTNTSTLAIWGKLLSICVASYGNNAADGRTLLLGVEKEGRIKYCIEFHSLAVTELEKDRLYGGLYQENSIPNMIEPEYVCIPYPKLLEKHSGVTPTDTAPEDEIYHIPSVVQFRGTHNGDPDPADRLSVEHMLVEWTKENFAFLSQLKGIFDVNTFSGYGQYGQYNLQGDVLNQQMIQDAANNAAQQGFMPNQLIVDRHLIDAINMVPNNHVNYDIRADQIFAGNNVVINA